MPGLARFNDASADTAERGLLSCCASPQWVEQVAAGRPYRDLGTLLTAADAALDGLPWQEVERALAAHPRIGDRISGADRESGWSRREQAGMASADPETRAALAQANREYEQRFGHVFLIFASGRSDAELLAAAQVRLRNDQAVERDIVRTELAKIVRLRLARLLE